MMDRLLEHLPGIKGKLLSAKFVLGVWDNLSDEAKLEIANAAVEKLKKMGEENEG